jgi:DNA-directed RNA polymerase specialized sigma24 family protein
MGRWGRPLSALKTQANPYEANRDYVLSVLARRCGWLDAGEREAAFHDAYAVMLEKESSGALHTAEMHGRQVRAYLTQTAIHKALDEGKRAERKRSLPLEDYGLGEPDPGASPDDLAAAGLDGARVREIVAELPERRQTIVKLRFFFDRAPDEIQRCLGISERVYRRDLERALKHIAERYELVRRGEFCDSRRSTILAYVAGLAGADRAAEARRHLASCSSCARWAGELRDATRRAAAMLPLPATVMSGRPLARLGELAGMVRDHVGGAAVGAKQQLATVATRIEPGSAGYAAAARPGAVASIVAGCVALGGGATYCAVEGVPDPVRSLLRPDAQALRRPHDEKKRAEPAADGQTVAPPPQPALPTEPTEPQPQPEPGPAPPPPTPTPVEREFGLEGSGEPAPSTAGGLEPASPSPSPAPSGPPGEFDP